VYRNKKEKRKKKLKVREINASN